MMGERNFQRRVSWLPNIKEPIGVSTGIAVFNTFGQYTGGASASGFHGRHRRGAIGVQPTAVARRTSLAWTRTVMPPQWPQAKGSSGRQAETQVRLDALTRQSWGDGNASTVAESQRMQRQASRYTSPAWCLNTTVLGGRWCIHSCRKPKEAAAGKPRHKSGLMH